MPLMHYVLYSGFMKRILVTTDFSPHSRHAIEYVLDLMKETASPCQIFLLNTYMVQHKDPDEIIHLNDELRKHSKANLREEKEAVLKKVTNPNIRIEVASHIGSLSNVILQLLQKEKIDLVVMGKSNGQHVEKVSNLLKQEKCPLLITFLKE